MKPPWVQGCGPYHSNPCYRQEPRYLASAFGLSPNKVTEMTAKCLSRTTDERQPPRRAATVKCVPGERTASCVPTHKPSDRILRLCKGETRAGLGVRRCSLFSPDDPVRWLLLPAPFRRDLEVCGPRPGVRAQLRPAPRRAEDERVCPWRTEVPEKFCKADLTARHRIPSRWPRTPRGSRLAVICASVDVRSHIPSSPPT